MSNEQITYEMISKAERNLKTAIFHIDGVHDEDKKSTVDVEDIDLVLAEIIDLRHRLHSTYALLEKSTQYCRPRYDSEL